MKKQLKAILVANALDDSKDIKSQLLELQKNDIIEPLDVPIVDELMKNIRSIKKKYEDKIVFRERGGKKSGIYYVYVGRKQVQAATREKLYEKLYDIEYGVNNYSMGDIFPLWMVWRRDKTAVSPRTLKNAKAEWEKFFSKQDIIQKRLVDVTATDLVKLYRSWTGKREITTQKFNNLKSIVNGLYDYANVELGIVAHNFSHDINMAQFTLKPVNNDDDVFSEDDRAKILAYLKDSNDMYDLAIAFDFNVTMRFAEISALRWDCVKDDRVSVKAQHLLTTEMNDDLTFKENYFVNTDHIKGHTAEGYRDIMLIPRAKEILEKARAVNPSGEYVFMFEGKQLSISTFNSRLKRYCHELGITPRTSHKIRFCVASVLHKNGMPLPTLQKMLGHTEVSTTLHYLRSVGKDDETLEKMMDCLQTA